MPRKSGQNRGVTTFKDRIKADITEAMKAREEAKLSTLRMVLSAIQNAEVAGDEAIVLTDDQVIKVLQSEAKKRAESAQIYADAGRTEAEAKERAELVVIEAYLPAAMSDDEVAAIVADEIAKAAAAGQTGGKAMGAVVKAVRDRVGSGADGGKIAALVKSALGCCCCALDKNRTYDLQFRKPTLYPLSYEGLITVRLSLARLMGF